jgi:hypothetical protein
MNWTKTNSLLPFLLNRFSDLDKVKKTTVYFTKFLNADPKIR